MTSESLRTLVVSFFRIIPSYFLLVGCASSGTSPSHRLVDNSEERYFELNERIAKQEAQINRLAGALEALKVRPASATSPAPVAAAKRLPPAKLAPADPVTTDEIVAEEKEALEPLDGETVADSKHEAMYMYQTGLRDLEAGKYEVALNSFREFLKTNPEHVYADRAQYQIAEAHFSNKEYGLAVVSTNLLESRYPYSMKVPDAIFTRALAYEGMGQREPALATLRTLLKRYPENAVAKLASRKLGELAAGAPTQPPLLLGQ